MQNHQLAFTFFQPYFFPLLEAYSKLPVLQGSLFTVNAMHFDLAAGSEKSVQLGTH